MNHFEAINHIISENQYDRIKDYKQKLETYKIRKYGLDTDDLSVLSGVYSEITGEPIQCNTCGGKLYLHVVLSWIHNFENKTTKTTTEPVVKSNVPTAQKNAVKSEKNAIKTKK